MTLLDEVKSVCDRLSAHGWKDLLLAHGLDLSASDLLDELTRDLEINRNIEGFEDFALEGRRGIEPGNPSRSLLYHALASPNVVRNTDGSQLQEFPTLHEIGTIENFVYGIYPPTIEELRQKADHHLSIAVFASEYRPAPETVHKKHADMCFSRAGVSRVGTKEPLYDPKFRGFLPFDENKNTMRVLPAVFSAYIAVRRKGNKISFGPMRFREQDDIRGKRDQLLDFWVPLHKLFSGPECIRGLSIKLELEAFHVNEKLRRIHLKLGRSGGWAESDINKNPFIFNEGIAEFSDLPEYVDGLLVPIVHPNLVEIAVYKGKPLTFQVPENTGRFSSLRIPSESDDTRLAPEYVHVRHKIEDGREVNLNSKKDMINQIKKGGYNALHYIDFTGDGWIKPICHELEELLDEDKKCAYSLVTAPDFFPNTDQRELMDWMEEKGMEDLKNMMWVTPPETLSDERIPPNLQLPQKGLVTGGINPELVFDVNDKTCTAIISLPVDGSARPTKIDMPLTTRHSYLPDAASGVFAPGWDISVSRLPEDPQSQHLASYGLGSPFPEDAKLCAALSTFWPAVAPDAARTFEPIGYPTVCPLTDEEIGTRGDNPWDGIVGPKIVNDVNGNLVEYTKFDYGDYVESALASKFSLSLTGRVDTEEYKSRLLAMARVYKTLKISADKRAGWGVISFNVTRPDNIELRDALDQVNKVNQSNIRLDDEIYEFVLYRPGNRKDDDSLPDHRKIRIQILESVRLYVDQNNIILKRSNDDHWLIPKFV